MTIEREKSPKSPKRVLLASRFWNTELVEGVTRHAAGHGWHLNLEMLTSGEFPTDWKGDGIIAQSPNLSPALKESLSKLKRPAVALSLASPEIGIPRVGIDNSTAGRMAAEHFLKRRFTQFAFYASPMPEDPTSERFTSFQSCLRSSGYDAMNITWQPRKRSLNTAWLDRMNWLRKRIVSAPKPLAVFALDDRNAADVIEACQMESIAIPQEVAVLGMLDLSIYREVTGVSLSSITVDFDAHSRIACGLLDRLMRGERVLSTPVLLPPTGISARESTETTAAHLPAVALAVKFMQDHYREQITMNDIAHYCGISYTKLCRQFAADLGESPYTVLTKTRIEAAKHLLSAQDPDLATIAESCGFGDRVNLHRNFMRYEHRSPGAYRREHQTGS